MLRGERLGLVDNWLQNVQDVRAKHAAQLTGLADEAREFDRLCELNVVEQVANVCEATSVQNAWARGHPLAVHGWIYAVNDGLLRDLGLCVTGWQELAPAYQTAVASGRNPLSSATFVGDDGPQELSSMTGHPLSGLIPGSSCWPRWRCGMRGWTGPIAGQGHLVSWA